MTKIYQNFSDFRAENKSIFKFLSKSDQRGLHEAIWAARDAEVQCLRAKIEELQEEREAWSYASLHQTQDNSLEMEKIQLKNEIQEWEKRERLSRERFDKSLALIAQLESHIERQKEENAELRENQKGVEPLLNEVKELRARLDLALLDCEDFKAMYEHAEKRLEQQEALAGKLRLNCEVLKEVSESAKTETKQKSQQQKMAEQKQRELEIKIAELEAKNLQLEQNLKDQMQFNEELKSGVRSLKQELIDKEKLLSTGEKSLKEIMNTMEGLKLSESSSRDEIQKTRAELEKARLEKERLTSEFRWLNQTVRDVQNSLGHIHKQYIRTPPPAPSLNQ